MAAAVVGDYQEQLKSNFADFANIGGRAAGSVTAACSFPDLHASTTGPPRHCRDRVEIGQEKGATGRPVPLLTTFLMKRAEP